MMKKESSLVTKEFLEDMLSSIEGGIVTIDKNGRITTFNRSAEEITGFKAEEALDKECSQIIEKTKNRDRPVSGHRVSSWLISLFAACRCGEKKFAQ